MQGYESIFILDPDTSGEQQTGLLDKFKSLIESKGGQVKYHSEWGRRKLAYEVNKKQYGIYHLFYLDRAPEALKALEGQFRLEDNVLKWFSLAVDSIEDEHADFERLRTGGTIAQTLTD